MDPIGWKSSSTDQTPGKVARALELLLADLNKQTPRMLDGGPILIFRLLGVNQIPPATDDLL